MAIVYITEFQLIGMVENGPAQIAQGAPVAAQTVVIGGGSTPSAAFNPATRLIRVHTDAICSIKIGTAPVATAGDARMAADQTEYFGVVRGDKLAVITNT